MFRLKFSEENVGIDLVQEQLLKLSLDCINKRKTQQVRRQRQVMLNLTEIEHSTFEMKHEQITKYTRIMLPQ